MLCLFVQLHAYVTDGSSPHMDVKFIRESESESKETDNINLEFNFLVGNTYVHTSSCLYIPLKLKLTQSDSFCLVPVEDWSLQCSQNVRILQETFKVL